MTPERLEQLKQHIKNPSSASLNAEWMMELVDEVEWLWRKHGAPVAVIVDTDKLPIINADDLPPAVFALKDTPEEHEARFEPASVVVDDRPKAKKGKK